MLGRMRALLAVLLTFVLTPMTARAGDWVTSSPEAQGMNSRALANLVAFGTSNGIDSLLITRHGRIVAEAYYAPFTSALKHRVNSTTKSVVGTLVAMALQDGRLKSVDQPVLDFFSDRQFANVDDRKKALKLRHLLDMTSGLQWDEPLTGYAKDFLDMERTADWVRFVLDRPMVRDPGASFEYNSGNTHLLSAILTKVTGHSARHYAREKLFGPLGIEDFFWRGDPQGNSGGGAGLYLLTRDMAKLGQFWLQDGVLDGKRVLPPGWLDSVRQATLATDLGSSWKYANCFWSLPSAGVYAALGYHRQIIMMIPDSDIVAVLTAGERHSTASGVPGIPKFPTSALVDRLKASVTSADGLPEDPAALALLAEKTKEAAQEVRTKSAAVPALAAAISGKVYRLRPNRLQVSTVSFTFDKDGASYAYESNGQRFGGPVGLDGLFRVGGRRLYGPSAAKGYWRDDKTFVVEAQTLGNDDVNLATFTFDGKTVSGRVSTFGNWIDVEGEAAD